jgi:5-methylcytosine-specific restriction endonuclease McrA
MIDLNLLKCILESKPHYPLSSNDYIDLDAFKFLSKYSVSKVAALFAPASESNPSPVYRWQASCWSCGVTVDRSGGKSKLSKDLQDARDLNSSNEYRRRRTYNLIECAPCRETRNAKDRELKEKWDDERRDRIENGAARFIELYLNPAASWQDGTTWRDAFCYVMNGIDSCHLDIVAEHIKQMPYSEFLKTPYWKAVAHEVYRKAHYRCQLCGSGGQIHAHHRSYSIHGREHCNLGDLIALCSDCHEKFHQESEVAA